LAYDTALILFQTVSRPDVRFRSVLKNELKRLEGFQGVTGLTSFDGNGDAIKNLYLLQIRGQRFVELEQR
jgi:branched-chain amino acid transport system substrate-binding protein